MSMLPVYSLLQKKSKFEVIIVLRSCDTHNGSVLSAIKSEQSKKRYIQGCCLLVS